MRLILSRKGSDSANTGIASPILPDGAMVSLPISSRSTATRSCLRFGDIRARGPSLSALVSDLSGGRLTGNERIHLDPDLDEAALPRRDGWSPSFGQVGAAQSHLSNQGVGTGDLFLFYGWFREVERSGGRWIYRTASPDVHAIFGWLQVGSVRRIDSALRGDLPWAADHPHLHGEWPANNTLYVAREDWRAPDGASLGAGVFPRFGPALQLTDSAGPRSRWRLPPWTFPRAGRTPLTFHASPKRWSLGPDCALLESAKRGQEFVLDLDQYPEAASWLRELFGGEAQPGAAARPQCSPSGPGPNSARRNASAIASISSSVASGGTRK